MYPVDRRLLNTRPEPLPAVPRRRKDITAAASLMTRSLKDVETAPVREVSIGTAVSVWQDLMGVIPAVVTTLLT